MCNPKIAEMVFLLRYFGCKSLFNATLNYFSGRIDDRHHERSMPRLSQI
jgi:hypothetical protein